MVDRQQSSLSLQLRAGGSLVGYLFSEIESLEIKLIIAGNNHGVVPGVWTSGWGGIYLSFGLASLGRL